MTLFKRFKRKQNKQQVSKYPLPDEYRGPNKILGKDVFVPLPPDKNGNVLILGSAGSGTIPSYVEPNIANTDDKSNCVVCINKPDAKDIIGKLTDRTVLELDLSTHPVDYFSLITDKSDAERFLDKMFEAGASLQETPTNGFFFDTEKIVLMDVITAVLEKQRTCDHKTIFEILLREDVADLSETFRSLPERTKETVLYQLLDLVYELSPGAVDLLTDVVDTVMHESNIVVFIEMTRYEKSVYEAIFLDEFVYRYKQSFDENAGSTKVIMAEAENCIYDEGMLCKETRQIGMSVDFVYQSIGQLIEQHPIFYKMIASNACAIVCLGTNDVATVDFLKEAIGKTKDDAIDVLRLASEYEVILCPALSKDLIVAEKMGLSLPN